MRAKWQLQLPGLSVAAGILVLGGLYLLDWGAHRDVYREDTQTFTAVSLHDEGFAERRVVEREIACIEALVDGPPFKFGRQFTVINGELRFIPVWNHMRDSSAVIACWGHKV